MYVTSLVIEIIVVTLKCVRAKEGHECTVVEYVGISGEMGLVVLGFIFIATKENQTENK